MKYLVNRKTKEHVIAPFDHLDRFSAQWDIVQADDEGWIKHTGAVCPLPDGILCEVKLTDENIARLGYSEAWYWGSTPSMGRGEIASYRPILKPEPHPTELQFTPRCIRCGGGGIAPHDPHCPNGKNLIDRLKAAHESAQTIPDLEAELRAVLAGMGYDLVARSPFVEPEAVVETPQDMSDWRNWREGDKVEAIEDCYGKAYGVLKISASTADRRRGE